MDWTLRGIDDATRRRAQAAADAASLPLADWLDRAIRVNAESYVPPSAWSDDPDPETADDDAFGFAAEPADDRLADPAAQAAIQRALDALESRLQATESSVTRLMAPMNERLDALAARAGEAPPLPLVLPPSAAYRRRLGLLAAVLLLLSLAGAGGLVWLWLELHERPASAQMEIEDRIAEDIEAGLARVARMLGLGDEDSPADSAPQDSLPQTVASKTGIEAEEEMTSETRAEEASAARDGAMPDMPAPVAAEAGASDGDARLVAQLRDAAAKNDAKAQHDLALLLMEGHLLPRDEAAATELFEQAAIQGLANAQYNLGVIYDHGIGRAADQTLAYFWYSAAADQGHVPAQYNLGVAAAQGRGAPRDYAVAALWFGRAAEGGLPDALYNLGQLYENGLGAPRDLDLAYGLYERAAAAGYVAARARMAVIEAELRRPPPTPAAPDAPPVKSDIAEIQTLLGKLALSSGRADGIAGPATRAAIRQYQDMAGLEPTGEPSLALLRHLREVAGAIDAR